MALIPAGPTPTEDAMYQHPSRDESNRFPADVYLRRHGFAIHSRSKDGDAIWERSGHLYTEQEALELADSR